jgi:hypothetical protein
MKHRRQRELQEKLTRIPRGPRGSAQNQFRNAVWFFASQLRYTFEEALDYALRIVRQSEPGFVPTILPAV